MEEQEQQQEQELEVRVLAAKLPCLVAVANADDKANKRPMKRSSSSNSSLNQIAMKK